MDIIFKVIWKDGSREEIVVENGYLPNLITTMIDIMRGDRFESAEIIKRARNLSNDDKL